MHDILISLSVKVFYQSAKISDRKLRYEVFADLLEPKSLFLIQILLNNCVVVGEQNNLGERICLDVQNNVFPNV